MNPDILSAIVAYLRQQPAVVAAFGEDLAASPPLAKFWSDYAGPVAPALPYVVLAEPSDRESYETADPYSASSSMRDTVIQAVVFASSKAAARQLAESLGAALQDAPLSIAGAGLIYFRRTGHSFQVVAEIGPDGSPTTFARAVQFRALTEHQP